MIKRETEREELGDLLFINKKTLHNTKEFTTYGLAFEMSSLPGPCDVIGVYESQPFETLFHQCHIFHIIYDVILPHKKPPQLGPVLWVCFSAVFWIFGVSVVLSLISFPSSGFCLYHNWNLMTMLQPVILIEDRVEQKQRRTRESHFHCCCVTAQFRQIFSGHSTGSY